MAKNSIRDFSATAGSNTDIQSVNIDESCPASGINNAIRELMADLKNVSTGAINLETPGADQLNVDNLRLDGNTISSTDTNGNITLDPNGTGDTIIASGDVGVGTTTPGTYTAYVSGSTSPGLVVAGTQPALVLSDTDISGSSSTLGITKSGDSTLINNLGGGNLDFYNNGGHRMRIESGGTVRINTTANQIGSGEIFSVDVGSGGAGASFAGTATTIIGVWQKTSGGGKALEFFSQPAGNGVGNINLGTSSTSYNTSSDHRLKQGVEDMTGAIDRVKALAPKRFQFIADPDTTVDGFLAHEAQTVVPEAVTGAHNEVDDDGNAVMQGIDQAKLVPVLTAALKESIAKIETLETKVAALENAE